MIAEHPSVLDMFMSALTYVSDRGESYAEAMVLDCGFFEELDAPVSEYVRVALVEAALCFAQGCDLSASLILQDANLAGIRIVRQARIADADSPMRWAFDARMRARGVAK